MARAAPGRARGRRERVGRAGRLEPSLEQELAARAARMQEATFEKLRAVFVAQQLALEARGEEVLQMNAATPAPVARFATF